MLWRSLTSLCEWFLQVVIGLPIALRRLMLAPGAAFHFAPRHSVAHEDVIRWDKWLNDLVAHRTELFLQYAPLTETREVGQFGCTIREVEGLEASKSPLDELADLDDMALQCTDFATEVSIANLYKNLQWRGTWDGPAIDEGRFDRFLWDGRIFWMNSDGSHHFVAARYLAGQLGVRVELKPRALTAYALIERNVRALLGDWEIFVVELHHPPEVERCLKASRVPFQQWPMWPAAWGGPWEVGRTSAILLPRTSPRARAAANVFRESGTFDLGAHLGELCARQQAIRGRAR